MASKLELRFKTPGVVGESVSFAFTNSYMFKEQRLDEYQVGISQNGKTTTSAVAQNFLSAFNTDDNYLGIFKTTIFETFTDEVGAELPAGISHYIVTIEHSDNGFFDGTNASTDPTFVSVSQSTTTQTSSPTIDTSITGATDACGSFKLNITGTNALNKKVTVEFPTGVQIAEYIDDGTLHELEIPRRTNQTTGIVKVFNDPSDTTPAGTDYFTAPGTLSISDIQIESSPFGVSVTINATSAATLYSLDNVNFQGSKEFSGLLEGNYTAYVKDSYGCTKSKTFVITQEIAEGLTAAPYINVPIHNSLRFAERSGNNFLNYLSTETPGFVPIRQYYQDYLLGDSVRTQFKSSYFNNRAVLIDENGSETEIDIIKKSDNIKRVNIYEGNYTEKDGRLAVYFTSGNIYNTDGTAKTEGHLLNGRLPLWYEEGLYLKIEGVGSARIDNIKLDEDGNTYAITSLTAAGSVTNVQITSIHTQHPYEVYEFDTFFLNTGKFQIRLEYWNDVSDKKFYLTEIIKIHEEMPEEYLTVQWWNENNNDILYNTGIRHFRRLKYENYFTYKPKTEKETYDTDTNVELINSKSFAIYTLSLDSMPMEVAKGLQYGLDNSDTIVIDGAKFVCEDPVKLEPNGQWYDFEADLTLTEQTMDGQQEIVDVVSAEFLDVATDGTGVSFLRLD